MSSTLIVEINRRDVTVAEFLEVVQAMIGLTDSVAGEMGVRGKTTWIIKDLQGGSAHLSAVPSPASATSKVIPRVLSTVGAGVASLQKSSKRPRYFNDTALEFVSTLARISTAREAGSARLVIGAVEVLPNESMGANADRLTSARQYSLGSIEGQLLSVSNSDGLVVYVRDRLRGTRIRCELPAPLLKKALRAFDQRVLVTGRIWWRPDGLPKKIEVEQLTEMVKDSKLPSVADVRGILSGAGVE